MRIRFRNFRSFHESKFITLKKVTLLVGGNSSGKTSFLAGLRYICELFNQEKTASFNKSPFFLGSFEEMSHYRGGRYGRSPSFGFDLEDTIQDSAVDAYFKSRFPPNEKLSSNIEAPKRFRISIDFGGYRNQPVLSSFSFNAGRFSFNLKEDRTGSIEIKVPSRAAFEIKNQFSSSSSAAPIEFRFLNYALMDAGYTYGRSAQDASGEPVPKDLVSEIRYLAALFELCSEKIAKNVHAFAPVRTEPQRVYNPSDTLSSSDGEQAPLILAQLSAFEAEKWKGLKQSLEVFGQQSGLFSKIDVKHLSRQKTGPFQITVNVGKTKSSIIDVGYGISQALPIVLEMLQSPRPTTFLMQQPEVHLHPKGQAELASFIGSRVAGQGHEAIIETHSDYIIDRFRMDVRDKIFLSSDDVNIVYLRRADLDTDVHEISIDEGGNIVGAPARYREFFLREAARSLDL